MFKITVLIICVFLVIVSARSKKKSRKIVESDESIHDKDENPRKVLENPELMEGDIVLPPDSLSRNAIASSHSLWPNGQIPVQVDSKYPHNTALINSAMEHIEQQTCIKFIPRTNEENYVFIFSGEGCYSHVGRIGGSQRLSLHAGCQNFGTVLHELLHAIGFYHAHNRSDRDKYLRINWNNIQQSQRHNFRQLSASENKLFFPNRFDFKSVMLYGPTAFSSDGRSITMSAIDKRTRFLAVRQKTKLSREDVLAINYLYKCETKPDSTTVRPANIHTPNRYPTINPVGLYQPFQNRPYRPYNQFYFPYYFG